MYLSLVSINCNFNVSLYFITISKQVIQLIHIIRVCVVFVLEETRLPRKSLVRSDELTVISHVVERRARTCRTAHLVTISITTSIQVKSMSTCL